MHSTAAKPSQRSQRNTNDNANTTSKTKRELHPLKTFVTQDPARICAKITAAHERNSDAIHGQNALRRWETAQDARSVAMITATTNSDAAQGNMAAAHG